MLLNRRSFTKALRPSSRKIIVGVLFLSYGLLCNLAVIRAAGPAAVITVLMIINLWPVFSLLFGVPLLGTRLRPLVFVIGLAFALCGSGLIAAEDVPDLSHFWSNIMRQPAALLYALVAALIWSICSNLMKKWSTDGDDYMPFNMGLTALVLLSCNLVPTLAHLGAHGLPSTFILFALFNAAGFLCWELGLSKGHIPTVISAAYFLPVTTCLTTAWYFRLPVTHTLLLAASSISLGAFISRASVKPAAPLDSKE